MAVFAGSAYGWAEEYINRRVADPRGTGGTPYMQWLGQLIAETRCIKFRKDDDPPGSQVRSRTRIARLVCPASDRPSFARRVR